MKDLTEFEEQHPIPQQISSYQFRLVGDMTLKQFMQLASGTVISIIIYSTGLPFAIKWPLILLSFLFGVALAFMPLQDRPLDKWIIAFFRSIYSPTIYSWQVISPKPQYFKTDEVLTTVTKQSLINVPVQSIPRTSTQTDKNAPKLTQQIFKAKSDKKMVVKTVAIPTPKPVDIEPTIPVDVQEEPIGIKIEYSPALADLEKREKDFLKSFEEVSKQLEIPKSKAVSIEQVVHPTKIAINEIEKTEEDVAKLVTKPVAPLYGAGNNTISRSADFAQSAAPPIAPSAPNLVTGQVLNPEGGIVESAILEIKDSDGRSARAFKSNKLGHFMIATPLVNGVYSLHTEADNLLFDTVQFEAKGEIIPPIAVNATSWEKTKGAN